MFIVEVDIRLHALCYMCHNKPFDCCLLLSSNPLFLGIMLLPLRCEEVCETAQSLALPLDLPFPFTELAQSIDVCRNTCISYGLYGPSHHIIHLEALFQQVQVIFPITWGYLRSWFSMEYIAVYGGCSSHGQVYCWLPVMSFYV